MIEFILLFSLISTLVFIVLNKRRARVTCEAILQPNCLLTKHPLLFISGKKSIFYFLKYWNLIPEILTQHGFEVYALDLPWRKTTSRIQVLKSFLTQAKITRQKYHLIIDSSTEDEVRILFTKNYFESIASCTLFNSDQKNNEIQKFHYPLNHPIEEVSLSQTSHQKSIIWTLHQLWTQSRPYSPHAIGYFNLKDIANLQPQLLQQTTLLAERDFVFNNIKNNQGNTHHDRLQSRNLRHQEYNHNFSSPPR